MTPPAQGQTPRARGHTKSLEAEPGEPGEPGVVVVRGGGAKKRGKKKQGGGKKKQEEVQHQAHGGCRSLEQHNTG